MNKIKCFVKYNWFVLVHLEFEIEGCLHLAFHNNMG
jgi:hypothetical protein